MMLGREAYHRPMLLAQLHQALYPHEPVAPRGALLERMACYAEQRLSEGHSLSSITRHMLGLCTGEPGAREYRRVLSEGARQRGADAGLIRRVAAAVMPPAEPDASAA